MVESHIISYLLSGEYQYLCQQYVDELGISAKHFKLPYCRDLFDTIMALYKSKQDINIINILEVNKKYKSSDLVKLHAENHIITILEFKKYLIRLKKIKQDRDIVELVKSFVANIKSGNDAVSLQMVEDIKKLVAENNLNTNRNSVEISGLITEGFSYLDDILKKKIIMLKTGFKNIDSILEAGFQPGNLIILAARPSVGKSALAQSIFLNIIKSSHTSLFVSLEMSQVDLFARLMAMETKIPNSNIRSGKIDDNQLKLLNGSANDISKYPAYWLVNGHSGIERMILEIKKINDLKFIVIDYLQLMETEKKYNNRNLEISSISRNLKELAVELNIPIMVLSQLNRSIEGRADKEPQLFDLRDSGAIEQDADTVIFIWDKNKDNPEADQTSKINTILEGKVAKNRSGRIGYFKLNFFKPTMLFEEITNQEGTYRFL